MEDAMSAFQWLKDKSLMKKLFRGGSDTIIPFALGQQVYQVAVDPKQ
jgi:hypothetical protein